MRVNDPPKKEFPFDPPGKAIVDQKQSQGMLPKDVIKGNPPGLAPKMTKTPLKLNRTPATAKSPPDTKMAKPPMLPMPAVPTKPGAHTPPPAPPKAGLNTPPPPPPPPTTLGASPKVKSKTLPDSAPKKSSHGSPKVGLPSVPESNDTHQKRPAKTSPMTSKFGLPLSKHKASYFQVTQKRKHRKSLMDSKDVPEVADAVSDVNDLTALETDAPEDLQIGSDQKESDLPPFDEEEDEVINIQRKLNTDWMHAALPLHDLDPERGTPGLEFNRILGTALDKQIGSYYVDLGMRDFRIFLAHVLKELGIPYYAAAYRQVAADQLATLLRRLGIPPRSELMNALCDNLIWCEDNYVSFAKLVEMSGDLEIENFGRESSSQTAVERARRAVELKIKLEEESYDRERLAILRDREARDRKYAYSPKEMILKSLRRPESFTPTTIRIITTLYEMYQQGKINQADFVSGVVEVTGAKHSERLQGLIQAYHADSGGNGKINEMRLQDVLICALKDAQDEAESKGKNISQVLSFSPRNKTYTSPITNKPLTGRNEGSTIAQLLDDDMRLQAGGMPSQETLQWFHQVLSGTQKFPQIPLERDINNLKQLCASIATGWINTSHFKQLCDKWDLPLNEHLGRAVRDHQARGRCSLRTLWKGVVIALEQNGCHI